MSATKLELKEIGPYEILALIAEGGMGTVYRARHRENGELVALKVLPAAMANNPVLLQRFEQEFRAASRLVHPNIVRAIELGRHGKVPYIVMELVDGESLGQRVERLGRLPEAEAVDYIVQVAQGLYRAHQLGIIHRDVKPDNILVDGQGRAKLADLGLVKDLDADLNLTRTGRGLGTPHFMAPEQFRNAKNADVRCDIYSLGATLYMLVTGQLPFRSCSPLDAWIRKINNDLPAPRQLRPDLSSRVDWAIRRAMSADPDRRPADVREFVEDLLGQQVEEADDRFRVVARPAEDWYVFYANLEGHVVTRKGSLAAIRRALLEGKCGPLDKVQVGFCAEGPFQPLREFAELRDLVMQPGALSLPRASQQALKQSTYIPAATDKRFASPEPGAAHPAPSARKEMAGQTPETETGHAPAGCSEARQGVPAVPQSAQPSAAKASIPASKTPGRSAADLATWLLLLLFALVGFVVGLLLLR
jgi:serine/threonine protein kinase